MNIHNKVVASCLSLLSGYFLFSLNNNAIAADYLELIPPPASTGSLATSTTGGVFDLGGDCLTVGAECFGADGDGSVVITAQPAAGFNLGTWTGACSGTTGATCVVPLVTNDPGTVTASHSFAPTTPPVLQLPLSVNVVGGEYGTVLGDGGISCPTQCDAQFDAGSMVNLGAFPTPGAVFKGWSGGGCSGTGSCSVLMNTAQTVTAVFEGDADGDGVTDPNDRCPDTPPGAEVDEHGCEIEDPASPPGGPEDSDGDGVPDGDDACPGTPAGEEVDGNGCSASQLDGDQDGVSDAVDECPDTPAGADVDDVGCADTERDSDRDSVSDADDRCPDTPPGAEVDADGCSVEQNFGDDLAELPGLTGPEQVLGARIDEVCPLLLELADSADLTRGQRDLLAACLGLKSGDTTEQQAADALRAISLRELQALVDYVVELGAGVHEHLGARLRQVAGGGGRGASIDGLNIRAGDQMISGAALQSAFADLLGMAAGEESFVDFGKLGLFLQGDLNFGDKDENELETGYDFDAWSVTFGGDYRFSDRFFGGASLSYGEVEVDYDGQRGSSDIENWTFSLYGGWQLSANWFLDGLASYGSSEFDMTRRIVYTDVNGTFDTTQQSGTDGEQIFLGLNTGYMLNRGSWRLGPIASVAYLDGTIDGFDETTRGPGSLAWNFRVDDRDYQSLRFSAGFQADYIWNTGFGVLIPGVRATYVVETEDEGDQIALDLIHNPFAEELLDSQRIIVETAGRDSSFVDASLNLSAQFKMGFSGFASYRFYSAYDDYSRDGYTIGLRWDKPY